MDRSGFEKGDAVRDNSPGWSWRSIDHILPHQRDPVLNSVAPLVRVKPPKERRQRPCQRQSRTSSERRQRSTFNVPLWAGKLLVNGFAHMDVSCWPSKDGCLSGPACDGTSKHYQTLSPLLLIYLVSSRSCAESLVALCFPEPLWSPVHFHARGYEPSSPASSCRISELKSSKEVGKGVLLHKEIIASSTAFSPLGAILRLASVGWFVFFHTRGAVLQETCSRMGLLLQMSPWISFGRSSPNPLVWYFQMNLRALTRRKPRSMEKHTGISYRAGPAWLKQTVSVASEHCLVVGNSLCMQPVGSVPPFHLSCETTVCGRA